MLCDTLRVLLHAKFVGKNGRECAEKLFCMFLVSFH